jgi:hypothetical protein
VLPVSILDDRLLAGRIANPNKAAFLSAALADLDGDVADAPDRRPPGRRPPVPRGPDGSVSRCAP